MSALSYRTCWDSIGLYEFAWGNKAVFWLVGCINTLLLHYIQHSREQGLSRLPREEHTLTSLCSTQPHGQTPDRSCFHLCSSKIFISGHWIHGLISADSGLWYFRAGKEATSLWPNYNTRDGNTTHGEGSPEMPSSRRQADITFPLSPSVTWERWVPAWKSAKAQRRQGEPCLLYNWGLA